MTLTMREACELIDQGLAEQQARADAAAAAAADRAATAAGWPRPLSGRELQVVTLLCEGLTTAQVADRLSLSPLTVKSHLRRIGRVVGTGDQAGIVGACFRAGVIQ